MTVDVERPPAAGGRHRPAGRGRLARVVLGRPEDPRWARPALLGVLALAAVLYTWALGRNGYANDYYSAAILSGTRSWKAFFFGAVDAGSFITVDKPPFALWVMGLSARIFGFGTWSMLLPQALAGVGSVALVHSAVRRAFGGTGVSDGSVSGGTGVPDGDGRAVGETPRHDVRPAPGGVWGHVAGLVAALVMTLTPITVAINRDNNPDTILVLLLVAAAWFCAEAIRTGRTRTLVLCGLLVGMAFTTKMLQAYLVLPAFALVYLYAAPGRILARLARLLVAGAVLVASSAWWMVVVDLWPAADRPYIGGSTDNTVWDLVIGYNGLGRIFGGEGAAGRGGGGGGFGGASGAGRLFNDVMAGQISWLIPFAALALVAGLVLTSRRSSRKPALTGDRSGPVLIDHRSGPVVTGDGSGHVRTDDRSGRGLGRFLPERRSGLRAALLLWGGWLVVHYAVFSFSAGTFHPYYSTALAPAVSALAGLGGVLMWQAYLRTRAWAWVLPLGIAVTGAWAFAVLRRTPEWAPWLAYAVAGLCAVAAIGLLVLRLGGRGRARLAAVALVLGLAGGLAGPTAYALTPLSSAVNGTNPTAGPAGSGGFGGMGGSGGPPGMRGRAPGSLGNPPAGAQRPSGTAVPPGAPSGTGRRAPGGFGGGRGGDVSAAMISYLERNRGGATWLLAVSSAQSASSIILSTGGEPVIAMGGFTGSDAAMTVAKLREYVSSGRLKYLMLGGGMGGPERGNDEVTAWVKANGTLVDPTEYGGSDTAQSLYKLG
ncbi:glycosyltransferase family 39 protein [Sphaerisporangium viridialbum]|uniref:glycosyltransferase family 39 protein n=1 Tax=Sphaerisporangium viridialbum TaxID=46189 RepID=UPI003C75C3D4